MDFLYKKERNEKINGKGGRRLRERDTGGGKV